MAVLVKSIQTVSIGPDRVVSETRMLSVRQGYIVRSKIEQRNDCDTFEDHEREEETI